MRLEDLTLIIENPLSPTFRILAPSPETIRELVDDVDDALEEALARVEEERPWQPADDFPPEASGTFVVSR